MSRSKPARAFSVYLLTPTHSDLRLATSYIGFSVNPFHRKRQHNGEIKGGAKKTSRHRPWEIVCILTGFPDNISALQFEWMWQHPYKSKLSRNVLAEKLKGKRGIGQTYSVKRKLIELHWILATCAQQFSSELTLQYVAHDVYRSIHLEKGNISPEFLIDLPSMINVVFSEVPLVKEVITDEDFTDENGGGADCNKVNSSSCSDSDNDDSSSLEGLSPVLWRRNGVQLSKGGRTSSRRQFKSKRNENRKLSNMATSQNSDNQISGSSQPSKPRLKSHATPHRLLSEKPFEVIDLVSSPEQDRMCEYALDALPIEPYRYQSLSSKDSNKDISSSDDDETYVDRTIFDNDAEDIQVLGTYEEGDSVFYYDFRSIV